MGILGTRHKGARHGRLSVTGDKGTLTIVAVEEMPSADKINAEAQQDQQNQGGPKMVQSGEEVGVLNASGQVVKITIPEIQ